MGDENISVERIRSLQLQDLLDEANSDTLQIIEADAEKGNVAAIELLAILHQYGMGYAEKDEQLAFEMYESAASKGSSYAMGKLAEEYYFGKRDAEKAFEIAKKGADAGDARSLDLLANMYGTGIGTEKNLSTAVEYLGKAATLKDLWAMFSTGVSFYEGIERSQDKEKGEALLIESARLGSPDAMIRIAHYYIDANEKMDEAEEWLKRAYKIGSKSQKGSACYELGILSADFKNDYETSRKYLERAVELGNKSAKDALEQLEEIIISHSNNKMPPPMFPIMLSENRYNKSNFIRAAQIQTADKLAKIISDLGDEGYVIVRYDEISPDGKYVSPIKRDDGRIRCKLGKGHYEDIEFDDLKFSIYDDEP